MVDGLICRNYHVSKICLLHSEKKQSNCLSNLPNRICKDCQIRKIIILAKFIQSLRWIRKRGGRECRRVGRRAAPGVPAGSALRRGRAVPRRPGVPASPEPGLSSLAHAPTQRGAGSFLGDTYLHTYFPSHFPQQNILNIS